MEAAAASERVAGGADTAARERVWAENGLMGGVYAMALDAAAAWGLDGFVGICFCIVRLLIGATAAATEAAVMVEVDRIACCWACQCQF